MERERSSSRRDASSSPLPPPPPLGFRSWLLLLLFSLLLLLFFPSFLSSSSRGSRPFAIRNGWDALYLLLVLFAILCGVLSRRSGGGDDSDGSPHQSPTEEWLGFAHHRVQVSHSHQPTVQASPGTGVLGLRSGGSYPLLRPDGATLDAGGSSAPGGWHRYDDTQLYRQRGESGGWERERATDFEPKMIAVDTYVPRRSPSQRSRSPPSPPSPPLQPPPTGRAVDELPVREVEKNEIFDSENPDSPPSSPPPEHPSQRQPRRRRRKAEKVPESREIDKDEIFATENPHSRSPSQPPLTQRQRRKRSMEKFLQGEAGQNATSEEKNTPPQASSTTWHRRRGSIGDIPKGEVDQDPNLRLEKPHASLPASPPSPPPAIPSPQPQQEERKRHKKRSGGGAKDIAAAIALFYPKKKGIKMKIFSNETTPGGEDPASSAPPPPPPPPLPPPPPPHSSLFHLFSQKKGGSKNRRIHSDSASAQPLPPPPPPTLTRQSMEQVLHSSPSTPSPPPPAPPSHNSNDKGKEKVYANESSSLTPSSSLSPRPEKSSLSSPFPPRPPSSKHHPISEEEMTAHRSRGEPEEEVVAMMKFKERESKERVVVSCPSPDVDDKADLFIARCHANWKLEKQNSMREKQRRKQRK